MPPLNPITPTDPNDPHCPPAPLCRHWLASAYPPFAVPYFVYDVYAMFLCHRHRRRLKGHEDHPGPSAAVVAFLRRELLMVLHHAAMVLVCFPVATVGH